MDQQGDERRVLSVEEGLALASDLRDEGRLADAETVCRKILAVAPNYPEALHLAGILAHQQGRPDEAVRLIERSLDLEPQRADWFNNLGIVLRAVGRLDQAEAAYRLAIALDPQHANAHSNLGVLLRVQGRLDEAEAAYRAATRTDPNHLVAYHNLAQLLDIESRSEESAACFRKVAALCPIYPSAQYLLAVAYSTLGETDKAVEILERWLEDDPGNAVAEHMLAGCTGRGVPARASDAFVEMLFDGFAPSFEAKLEKLAYRVPAILSAILADTGLRPSKALDILDAGCGTGLCAPILAPYARRLIGVDLSEGMLRGAAGKQLYDELVRAELTAYLRSHADSFDLVVSGDTLVYFGALEEAMSAAASALRRGGLLLFTVEEWVDPPPDAAWRLCRHGRYNHAAGYVEGLLRQVGLAPAIARADLRVESGAPVAGLVVSAAKP